MDNLLLHDTSRLQLNGLLRQPSHAILITGPAGSGKWTIARHIATRLLNIDEPGLDSYPYFTQIAPEDKAEIPIDAVRQLLRLMRLKTPGSRPLRRIVLIENGNKMSTEAQNAILKILEEPGNDTAFLITAKAKGQVLPTIASRAQHVSLQAVSLETARNYFDKKYSPATVESSWRLSRGAAGILISLLRDGSAHPLKQAVEQSKKFLSSSSYGRLLVLETIISDKNSLKLFIEALSRVIGALHQESIGSNRSLKAERLLSSRKLLHQLNLALEQNTSPKLICLKLVMNLRV